MAEILSRDQNFVTVGGAVTDDSDQGVTMLRVDPVTKYLLVDILSVSSAPAASSSPIAARDQNHVPVALAWDETNGVVQELLTDDEGNLLCDIEVI